jgi:hypothetical protein
MLDKKTLSSCGSSENLAPPPLPRNARKTCLLPKMLSISSNIYYDLQDLKVHWNFKK